jgi:hypothetical protein
VEAAAVTDAELARLADLVVDKLAERLSEKLSPAPRFVSVRELADALGVDVGFVYRHAGELGGRKLGPSRNAPLRFDLLRATEALRELGERSPEPEPVPPRRSRRRASAPNDVPLLPIRPSRGKP